MVGIVGERGYDAYFETLNLIEMGANVSMTFYWVDVTGRSESSVLEAHGAIARRLQTRLDPCG
jgi:hypothetical protein